MEKSAGFDNEKYLAEQSSAILDRLKLHDNRLYLEFGGSCFSIITPPGFFRVTIQTSKCGSCKN